MPDEWYRSWRHDDRAYLERIERDPTFRRWESVGSTVGLVAAIAAVALFGWASFH